jgi:transposase
MGTDITVDAGLTIGIDVSDRSCEICVLSRDGEWLGNFQIPTKADALQAALSRYRGARVVLEVGTHSPWMSRLLAAEGFEVIVANPRRVRLIAESDSKNDKLDSQCLARLGRIDPQLLHPIKHRGEDAQRARLLLSSRDGLVRARTLLVNEVRGFAKSVGTPMPAATTRAFAKRVREAGQDELFPGASASVETIAHLTDQIGSLDRQIGRLCDTSYPETALLRQVAGVGPITALTFVLTLDDPSRFATSRAVAAYLGLRPRQRDSGSRKPQLRITKAGDRMLRRLLVSAAHYILGPFGPDTELRRFGLRIAQRGGASAKKRAAVAVARKLAVLLHRLWVTGETYEPLGYGKTTDRAA